MTYSVSSSRRSSARLRAFAGPPFGTVRGVRRSSSAARRMRIASVPSEEPSFTTKRRRSRSVWSSTLRTEPSIQASALYAGMIKVVRAMLPPLLCGFLRREKDLEEKLI